MSAVAFPPRHLVLPLVVLLGGGAALWWGEGKRDSRKAEDPHELPAPTPREHPVPSSAEPPASGPPASGPPASGLPLFQETDLGDEPVASTKKLPHPESPRRNELLRARSWREEAKAAASRGDAAALRRLLEERKDFESSADFSDWWQGYAIILACIERPGAASTRSAQRFVDDNRGSNLRRDVRRYCEL